MFLFMTFNKSLSSIGAYLSSSEAKPITLPAFTRALPVEIPVFTSPRGVVSSFKLTVLSNEFPDLPLSATIPFFNSL